MSKSSSRANFQDERSNVVGHYSFAGRPPNSPTQTWCSKTGIITTRHHVSAVEPSVICKTVQLPAPPYKILQLSLIACGLPECCSVTQGLGFRVYGKQHLVGKCWSQLLGDYFEFFKGVFGAWNMGIVGRLATGAST